MLSRMIVLPKMAFASVFVIAPVEVSRVIPNNWSANPMVMEDAPLPFAVTTADRSDPATVS